MPRSVDREETAPRPSRGATAYRSDCYLRFFTDVSSSRLCSAGYGTVSDHPEVSPVSKPSAKRVTTEGCS